MEQLKFSYQFSAIKRISVLRELPKGTFVCIIHADKIPPHLGLLVDQKFFSLKTKGKDVNVPLVKLETILSKKRVATVFVELKAAFNLLEIQNYFNEIPEGLAENQTCLHPLIQLLDPDEVCSTIADLLKCLDRENLISTVFGVHLSPNYIGILDYDRKVVENRIKSLRDVERN